MLLLQWRLIPLAFVITSLTEAGTILFPAQLHDDCTTSTGERGKCAYSCELSSSLSEPSRCGIKDSKFLYCCNTNLDNVRQPSTDISPPRNEFQCGRFKDRPSAGCQKELLGSTCEEVCYVSEGKDASENFWPWMALLGKHDGPGLKWFCGGSLINLQWVITAAHCINLEKVELVRLGEYDHDNVCDEPLPETFTVLETVVYPDYNPPEAYHDLALIKLSSTVTIQDHISPVCMPWGTESDKDITGQQATLTGWGDTEFDGFPSSILQQVNVTVFLLEECDRGYSTLPHYQSTWPRGIKHETLCAGDPAGGRDACQGDSGGPLMAQDSRGRFVLAGIVSKGYGCGHKDYPGLYANMRHPYYLAWIKKIAFGSQ